MSRQMLLCSLDSEIHFCCPSKQLQALQYTRPLTQLPLVGPLFTPPVNVTSVANVAVRAATDPVFPPGIVDVYGIQKYSQKSR